MKDELRRMAWVIALAACVTLLAAATRGPQSQDKPAQQQPKQQGQATDQKTDQKQPAQQQPKPLFKGKVKLSSSRQGENTASAGFNGVGPDGKIQEALLKGSPSAAARQKAARLSLAEVDAAEVQAFAKEGKLNPPPAKKGK